MLFWKVLSKKRTCIKPASPTALYKALQEAYDWFNAHLFHRALLPSLITLNRPRLAALAYFAGDRFCHRADEQRITDEIALNPDTFAKRSDKEILSTLAHEMVHLWQHHFGRPGRRGYHNRQWANQMEAIGLMPSDTGELGGKRTGEHVSHYIIPCGSFDQAADRLIAKGFRLYWQSPPLRNGVSTTQFQCPLCSQNAWAKPSALLVCGRCSKEMKPLPMRRTKT